MLKLRTGVTHSYEFFAGEERLGARRDVAGYQPDSYPRPNVPKGTLSERKRHTSKIYPGMAADYSVHVSPGYDDSRGAALMIWQDGQSLISGDLPAMRLLTVTENLASEVDPSNDPPDDLAWPAGYARSMQPGIFPTSSAVWHSAIGSFVSIQWRYNQPTPVDNREGCHVYPFLLRKEPKRNIRVWLSDGVHDNEDSRNGSHTARHIRIANSLKLQGYDFHFRFGKAAHNSAQAALDLPESLAWLWRDYGGWRCCRAPVCFLDWTPIGQRFEPAFRIRMQGSVQSAYRSPTPAQARRDFQLELGAAA